MIEIIFSLVLDKYARIKASKNKVNKCAHLKCLRLL
jgi:hypothetical protein